MSFFDQLIDTPDYQAKTLAAIQPNAMGGLPPMDSQAPVQMGIVPPVQRPMVQPQGYAKGGLTDANKGIQQVQIMKVIANYFKNKGLPVAPAMAGVQKEVQNGLQLIPYQSSVMGYKPISKNVAQIHFFTVGTMKNLADDMKYFYKYLKDHGITTVYDSIPAPITTQMFQNLGAKLEQSDNPRYKFKASI